MILNLVAIILKVGGKIRSVSAVEVANPPNTTIARGFCTSLPTPPPTSIGTSPSAAIVAVINTGRNLRFAPISTASSTLCPLLISCTKYPTITSPLSTAIPNNVINPILAGTEKYSPDKYNDINPPVTANGIFNRIIKDNVIERKVKYKIKKITKILRGMTVPNLAFARCAFAPHEAAPFERRRLPGGSLGDGAGAAGKYRGAGGDEGGMLPKVHGFSPFVVALLLMGVHEQTMLAQAFPTR